MSLRARLDARLVDIDSQIAHVRDEAAAALAKLQVQRQQLIDAAKLITPEIEATVAGLRSSGLLGEAL